MRYSNHFCKLRAELQAYAKTTFKLAPSGKRGSLGLEWLEGLLYQTPGTFSQHTLLEALIVTGGSPPYFGEQYRDLLLNLYRKFFSKTIFLVLCAAYFVVREEGMYVCMYGHHI